MPDVKFALALTFATEENEPDVGSFVPHWAWRKRLLMLQRGSGKGAEESPEDDQAQ